MAFCKFSSEYIAKSYTIVDNIFFTRYLPFTPPKLSAVYLYGLFLCSNENQNSTVNDIKAFADGIGLSTEEVLDAFNYWQEQQLIKIVSLDPPQIQYLPIRGATSATKKYKDKYGQFNLDAQNIITGRMISPNEFEEYYTLMEGYSLPDGRRFTPEALLMVMRYCAENKGPNVNFQYIITVAKNWAHEGIITTEAIEKRLEEYSASNQALSKIMKALGSSKKLTYYEHEFYKKWTRDFDFTDETILFVAKMLKKGGIERLDRRLQKYFQMHLFSEREILGYEENKDKLYALARKINKLIGVYYEDVENEIETYVNPWLNKGYSPETLCEIAMYCFENDKRSLKKLNEYIESLYVQGVVTAEAYRQHNEKLQSIDTQIKQILKACELKRNVNAQDREFYSRWINNWAMPLEVIMLAASLSQDKSSPISYINKILASWHEQKIHTLDEAKLAGDLFKKGFGDTGGKDKSMLKKRKYTDKELDSIIDTFKEIEI